MDWSLLAFLAEPWFVGLWYLVRALGAVWVAYDSSYVNTRVNFALKLAWPIIVFFFSVIGIVAYLITCRPRLPGRGGASKEEHHAYVEATWKKVTGSLIHCVGGDGFGIMTAMVIARPAVVIETGRWVNVLGFLDLGAQEKEVSAEQILFGEKAAVWLEPRRGS